MPARIEVDVPELPLTLYPSRGKQILYLLICLVFAAIGVMMLRDGDWRGWLCCGLFGLGALVFVLNMLPGALFLRLTEDGFIYRSLFRAHTTRWTEVGEFGLALIPIRFRHKKLVGWNFAQGAKRQGTTAAMSREISGYEAALPDTYGLKAEELAQMMALLCVVHGGGLDREADGEMIAPQFEHAEWTDGGTGHNSAVEK